MNTKLKKSDWILIVIVYCISTTVNTIDYYREGNMLKEYFIDFSSSILLSLITVLLFFYWLIPNFLVKKQRYFLFIFLGLLILFIGGSIDLTAGYWSGENDWSKFYKGWDFFLRSIFRLADDGGLLLGVLLTKKFYEGKTEYVKIENQQKENELKLLRSQLDPHFLFNNLNTLDALIDSNPTKAKEYINRLSLIYRYLIQTKDSEVMELQEELTLAENYIFLIKTRFGNAYDFTIEKPTLIDNKFIPTGALQTLLENVVKHNKVSDGNTIKTTIVINKNSLKITNKKSKLRSVNPSFGTGLENLKTRYKLLTDKEVLIKNLEHNFSVTVPVINLEA